MGRWKSGGNRGEISLVDNQRKKLEKDKLFCQPHENSNVSIVLGSVLFFVVVVPDEGHSFLSGPPNHKKRVLKGKKLIG